MTTCGGSHRSRVRPSWRTQVCLQTVLAVLHVLLRDPGGEQSSWVATVKFRPNDVNGAPGATPPACCLCRNYAIGQLHQPSPSGFDCGANKESPARPEPTLPLASFELRLACDPGRRAAAHCLLCPCFAALNLLRSAETGACGPASASVQFSTSARPCAPVACPRCPSAAAISLLSRCPRPECPLRTSQSQMRSRLFCNCLRTNVTVADILADTIDTTSGCESDCACVQLQRCVPHACHPTRTPVARPMLAALVPAARTRPSPVVAAYFAFRVPSSVKKSAVLR